MERSLVFALLTAVLAGATCSARTDKASGDTEAAMRQGTLPAPRGPASAPAIPAQPSPYHLPDFVAFPDGAANRFLGTLLLGMKSMPGAGDPMRKKTDATAQSETEKIPFEPPKPRLEFMARFEVNLDAPVLELGQIEGFGKRRIIPITGGKFAGPRLSGTILNNGADWQMVSADGVAYLDTRYALKTEDGALIYIQTRGFRYGPAEVMAEVAKGNPVDPNKYYFRVSIQFETGSARYGWLNRAIGIGAGMRLRNAVIYDAYLVR